MLAEIHDGDARRDVAHHREVVRDQHQARPNSALQFLEQVDHLRLHGDVERRDRLVADDQLRLGGERPRDADALALAAREFVRIALACSGRRPTRAAARRRAPADCSPARCVQRSGSPTMSATVMRGLSEA
jgi:hypothetical protein